MCNKFDCSVSFHLLLWTINKELKSLVTQITEKLVSTKFIFIVIKKQNYRGAVSGWLAVCVLEKHHCIFEGWYLLAKNF